MLLGNEFEKNCEPITGNENIANGFNNYFVNVGPSLADNIPATDTHFSQYLSDSTNVKNSLFLNTVTEDEIVRVVAQLKPKKSKGHDELDMCLIKKLIPYIVVPLKHIFNRGGLGVFILASRPPPGARQGLARLSCRTPLRTRGFYTRVYLPPGGPSAPLLPYSAPD